MCGYIDDYRAEKEATRTMTLEMTRCWPRRRAPRTGTDNDEAAIDINGAANDGAINADGGGERRKGGEGQGHP